MKYDIYYGVNRFNKRKTYLVFTDLKKLTTYEVQKEANKFFKRSARHVLLSMGWIYNDFLYLDEEKPGRSARPVIAAYLV